MAALTIFGPSPSTFVRTARLAAAEKGVSYALDPVDFQADAYAALHPFKKVPAMRHGDFVLYETTAICRYIDAAFPGAPLQPADVKARATQDQWISACCDYFYKTMILDIALERFLAPMRGVAPDEAKIKAAWPKAEYQLGAIEKALAKSPYLAGAAPSLADFFLLPILFYVKMQPEGGPLLAKHKAVSAWFERMAARPSFAATMPEFPKKPA